MTSPFREPGKRDYYPPPKKKRAPKPSWWKRLRSSEDFSFHVWLSLPLVAVIGLVACLGYSSWKLEKEHPCLKYGPEYTIVTYIPVSTGKTTILVPQFVTTKDCLERRP